MFAGESQTLPGPLEQAEAAYRDAAAKLPVSGAMIARQARHFAADVRLSRDEPQAMRRLHEATGGLYDVPALSSLLPRALDGALALTGADFGTVQLLDPVTGLLRLVAQSGFDSGFVEYFAVVDDNHSACGRAAREGAQAVITDVTADPGFAPHRGIAAASGFRAVQSTPLTDDAGHLVGMVSTHFARPHRPAGLDLRIIELYADVAGEAIAAHLGDPFGRAEGPGSLESSPAGETASLDDTMTQLAEHIVNRLFSIGLSLDSARSIAGNGPAGGRVAAATDQVDRLIREIRDHVFAERGQGTLAGLPWNPRIDDQERSARTADRGSRGAAARAHGANGPCPAGKRGGLRRTARTKSRPDQAGRADYPAEIKRWRAFADQAEQMARRWEQSPLP